jgi:hypothetical protein
MIDDIYFSRRKLNDIPFGIPATLRRLRKLIQNEPAKAAAAAKAGVDDKTARKYLQVGKHPGETAAEHDWRTRSDPFE